MTRAAPSIADAVTPVGAPGASPGVTALDWLEAAPWPAALLARTVNRYEVPAVSPGTPTLVVEPSGVSTLTLPGAEVTVYLVIGRPPSNGAVQLTLADRFPGDAATPVGASGTVNGTTAPDGAEARLVPSPFVAVTVKV